MNLENGEVYIIGLRAIKYHIATIYGAENISNPQAIGIARTLCGRNYKQYEYSVIPNVALREDEICCRCQDRTCSRN